MTMLKSIVALFTAAMAVTLTVEAQAQSERAKFEVAFEAQETRRRALIAQSLELSEEEAAKFWPMYDAYRNEVKTIQLRQVENLSTFSANFNGLEDDVAEELIAAAVDIKAYVTQLNREHLKRVRRVISPVQALRYFQLDSYIDTAQLVSMQRQIPLAGTDLEQLYMNQQAAQQR